MPYVKAYITRVNANLPYLVLITGFVETHCTSGILSCSNRSELLIRRSIDSLYESMCAPRLWAHILLVVVVQTTAQPGSTGDSPAPTTAPTVTTAYVEGNRAALVALYTATNGPNWTTPWNIDDINRYCYWGGVTCEDNVVSAVDLQDQGQSPSITS